VLRHRSSSPLSFVPILSLLLLTWGLLAWGLVPAATAWAGSDEGSFEPITVILLRHAEKAAEPSGDPALTARGQARAEELARLLGESGVTALYSTDLRRTRDTLAPLAEKVGLPVQVVPPADLDAMVRAILSHPGGVVVSAGHSNTVGPIIEKLGGGPIPPIDDNEYDRLYVLTVHAPGKARVLRLSFEAPVP